MIKVNFYEKTYGVCPSCNAMKSSLNSWEEKHPSVDVSVKFFSVEDNLDKVKEKYPEVEQAPVIEVIRDGEVHMVSGNNPDILEDYLGGLDSVWDEA